MSPLGAKRSQLLRWTEAIGATPVVVASLSPQVSSVPVFRETAVIPSFRRADPHIAHFETFLREDLDGTHSLLLVLGSWRPSQGSFRWSPGDTVGLFLIKNSDPDFVWELAIASSHDDFALEVECANFSSVVWSSTIGMYGTPSDSIKTYVRHIVKGSTATVRVRPTRSAANSIARGQSVLFVEFVGLPVQSLAGSARGSTRWE